MGFRGFGAVWGLMGCQSTCGVVLHSLYMTAGLELYYIASP